MNLLLMACVLSPILTSANIYNDSITSKLSILNRLKRADVDKLSNNDIKVRNTKEKGLVLNKSDIFFPANEIKKELNYRKKEKNTDDINVTSINKDKVNSTPLNSEPKPGKEMKIILMHDPYERSGDQKVHDENIIKQIMAQVNKGNEIIKIMPSDGDDDLSITPNQRFSDSKSETTKNIDLIKLKGNKEDTGIQKNITISNNKPQKKMLKIDVIEPGSEEQKNVNDSEDENDDSKDELNTILEENSESKSMLRAIKKKPNYNTPLSAPNLQYRARSGLHDSDEKKDFVNSPKTGYIKASGKATKDETIASHHQHFQDKYNHGILHDHSNPDILTKETLTGANIHNDDFDAKTGVHYLSPTVNLNDALLLYNNNITLKVSDQNKTMPSDLLRYLNAIRYANYPFWYHQHSGFDNNYNSNQYYHNYDPVANYARKYYQDPDHLRNYLIQHYHPFINYASQYMNNADALRSYPSQSYQYTDKFKNYQSQYYQNYPQNYPWQSYQNFYAVENHQS